MKMSISTATDPAGLGLPRMMAAGLLIAASLLAVHGAHAAGLPPERHAGPVAFVSGGVADDEATAFKQAEARYPLAIELVEKAGAHNEFTADAHVRLMRADGTCVLDAKADGPFMLVRLPAGHYKVEASLKGHTVESPMLAITPQGRQHAMLVFPENAG